MYSIFQNPELQARYENSLARVKERNSYYERRGEKKGILIGKKRGELEGEITKIQDFKKLGLSSSQIYSMSYKYLKTNHIKRILEEESWNKLNSGAIFEVLQKESPKIIEE